MTPFLLYGFIVAAGAGIATVGLMWLGTGIVGAAMVGILRGEGSKEASPNGGAGSRASSPSHSGPSPLTIERV